MERRVLLAFLFSFLLYCRTWNTGQWSKNLSYAQTPKYWYFVYEFLFGVRPTNSPCI